MTLDFAGSIATLVTQLTTHVFVELQVTCTSIDVPACCCCGNCRPIKEKLCVYQIFSRLMAKNFTRSSNPASFGVGALDRERCPSFNFSMPG